MARKRFNGLVGYPKDQPLRLLTFGTRYIKIPTIWLGRPIRLMMKREERRKVFKRIFCKHIWKQEGVRCFCSKCGKCKYVDD